MENGSYEDAFSIRQAMMASNYCYKPLLSERKVFTCKYCGRRFLNSRALGGHQNAHKKERTLWMLGMSNPKPLGMEPHDGLLNNTIQQDTAATTMKKTIQSSKDLGEACPQQTVKEAAYLEYLDWPGSFNVLYSDSNGPDTQVITASYGGERILKGANVGDALDLVLYQQPDQSYTHCLDLDLHL